MVAVIQLAAFTGDKDDSDFLSHFQATVDRLVPMSPHENDPSNKMQQWEDMVFIRFISSVIFLQDF